MADVVSKAKRSEMMSGIRTKGTKAEEKVREVLEAAELEYELNWVIDKKKPDIVLKQRNVIILVHGCFWHAHQCDRFKWPDENADYWSSHLDENCERDKRNLRAYNRLGWRVLTIWECALIGKRKLEPRMLTSVIKSFIESDEKRSVIGD